MPSLPPAIPGTLWPDGTLVTSAGLFSGVLSLVEAIRARINPKTSIWHATTTATTDTIPDSTFTDLPLDATTVDTDGLGIYNGNGYMAPATGYYLCSGTFRVSNSIAGARAICLLSVDGSRSLNGVRNSVDTASAPSSTAVGSSVGLLFVKRGSVITVAGWQNMATVTGGPASGTLLTCALTVVRWA